MKNKTNLTRKYIFTLRNNSDFFGAKLVTDSFLESTNIPTRKLVDAVSQILMRVRFNPDLYPHVLMVSGEDLSITREMLEHTINSMEVDEQKEFIESVKIS